MLGSVILVPKDALESPPSVKDGTLTLKEEIEQRTYGCGWIQKAAILLRIPAETLASGQTIFHRFYYRRSMKEFDLKLVAAASLYLGCKLCETPRRIRDVVNTIVFLEWLEKKDKCLETLRKKETEEKNQAISTECEKIKLETSEKTTNGNDPSEIITTDKQEVKQDSTKNVDQIAVVLRNLEREIRLPDIDSKEFRRLKTNIHRVERHILRETGFTISQTLVHPHRYILQFIHIILGENVVSKEWKAKICQNAWGYLNDSMRTPLCCSVQPSAIAAAAIYMACSDYGLHLPSIKVETTRDGRINVDVPWYEGFQVDGFELSTVLHTIRELYVQEQPIYRHLADPPIPPAMTITPPVVSKPCSVSIEDSNTLNEPHLSNIIPPTVDSKNDSTEGFNNKEERTTCPYDPELQSITENNRTTDSMDPSLCL